MKGSNCGEGDNCRLSWACPLGPSGDGTCLPAASGDCSVVLIKDSSRLALGPGSKEGAGSKKGLLKSCPRNDQGTCENKRGRWLPSGVQDERSSTVPKEPPGSEH